MPAKASKRVMQQQQTLLSSSSSCPVKKTHTCVASNSKASGSYARENWASNLAACLKLWLTSTSSHLLLYKLNSFSTTSLFMSGMKTTMIGKVVMQVVNSSPIFLLRMANSLELPGLLMEQQGHLWLFWAILGPYGRLNSEKIHKIRTATCSTITCKTKKNNEIVQEVKLRKWLNSKVAGLISTLWSWSPTQFDHTHPIKGQSYHRYHLSLWRESC